MSRLRAYSNLSGWVHSHKWRVLTLFSLSLCVCLHPAGAKQAAATAAAAAAAADAAAAVAAAAAVDFPVTLADLTASVQRIEPDMFTNLTVGMRCVGAP